MTYFLEPAHLFLKSRTEAKLLFCKVWGSRSHNTNHEKSDWDFSGVFIHPTKSILGIDKLPDNYVSPMGEKPDCHFHELGKFASLLVEGNPGILEMLWTERMAEWDKDWNVLRNERNRFLSKSAVRQYLGYAEGQLKRLKAGIKLHTTGGEFNEKWAYHLLRLLEDSNRILHGEGPLVWKEGAEREFLMSVRRCEISCEEVVRLADDRIKEQNETLQKCDLSENSDKSWLNEWLVDLRLRS